MDKIIGLIPAAGKGLRLNIPFPKELYPIIRDNKYKPVAQYILENMLYVGVNHIVFVINDEKSQLIKYFGSGKRFGCNISYVVQEDLPDSNYKSTSPGLASAIDAAYHLTSGKRVVFGMADTIISPIDIFADIMTVPGDEYYVSMGLFKTDHPEKFGMVELKNIEVVNVVDKPKVTKLEYAWGFMYWHQRFTELIHTCVKNGIFDFANIINIAASKERYSVIANIILNCEYHDLGTFEEISNLNSEV